ncbi:ly6/PLAUR domain-containing protein 2-like [Rhinoderma darwinii]|uniref:ly6/PLAUR domain-containing protein 2-like n=1 Tax=Rhinoderma darwinii TaxID=43563 RepID=UPI003F6756C7
MKVNVIFLVVLALCYRRGGSVICYYCPSETFSSECTDQKNCTSNNIMCKTTVLSPDVGYPFQGNEVVIRDCSTFANCNPSDQDELGNSRTIFCCNTDLCNNRGLNLTSSANSHKAAQTSGTTGFFLLGVSVSLIVMGP